MTESADNAQQFFNTHAAAQLAILPQFSNKVTKDKFTATNWLAKVVNHMDGGDWTAAQSITHVRNGFSGSLLYLYESLKPLGVDITNGHQIRKDLKKHKNKQTEMSMNTMAGA
jgi:hypothetical protein